MKQSELRKCGFNSGFVVGITGMIGSGKSTVANIIEETYPVVDTDRISKRVLSSDESVITEVKERYKEEVMSDGEIDRGKLGDIIFNNKNERIWLNELMHPKIMEKISFEVNKWYTSNSSEIAEGREDLGRVCFVELTAFAPEHMNFLDKLLVVVSDYNLIEKRVSRRSGWSKEKIKAVYNIQFKLQKMLLNEADYVIENKGSMLDLRNEVEKALNSLLDGRTTDNSYI